MLEVKSVQNKDEQSRLCLDCAVQYDPDALCYAAYNDGVFTGTVQFGIRGQCGYIITIANKTDVDDKDSLFVAGRAALNFIDLCGVTDQYFIADCDEDLIKRIGFRKNENGEWYMNTKGFFTSETNGACESKSES